MLTAEQVAAEHPEAAAALVAQGASAERARIQGIEAQAIAGHEKLIESLKFDGKSTAGDAAMAIVAAERSVRTAARAALATDAPAPLPAAAPKAVEQSTSGKSMTRQELDKAAKAHMAANPDVDYIAAVKHVQAQAQA